MNGRTPTTTFWRQFLLSAGLILMTFLLLGTSFTAFMYSYRSNQIKKSLSEYAQAVVTLSAAYSTAGELEDNWNFQMSLTFAADAVGNDAVICNLDGTVVACSGNAVYSEHLGQTIDSDLLEKILSQEEVTYVGTLDGIYEDERTIVCLPLTSSSSGETIGVVIVSQATSDRTDFSRQLLLILFYTALPCMLIGLAASMIVAKRHAGSLRQMAEAAKAFAMGDFSVRVNPENPSLEICELAVAFNQMAASLEKSEALRQEFVASVSHELKTPMTTIAGFLDGMLDGTIPREKHRQYMQTVSDEIHRLSRLVRSMLEVSRLQEAEGQPVGKERFDAVELVSRVLLTYEQRINGKTLDVDAQFPELEVPVMANADSITRVVSNLIDNAVKFADPDSVLGIGVYTVTGRAYVFVRNTGPTIEPEELPHVFDRFHKIDKSRSADRDGVGLGLYLVKSILKAHGEEIVVKSQDGVTEFTFSLTLTK